jgi:HK97 family phage portal protein
MSWLTRLFNRGRTAPPDPRYNRSGYSHAPMAFVPQELWLSTDEMLSTSTVWAAVRAIVDPIASSEVKVFTREGGGRKHLVDDGVAYLLNVRPNPECTAQALKEILLTFAVVEGDGYAEIVPDGAGRVRELWPLLSEYMLLVRNPDTGELLYRYKQPGDGETVYLPASRVLHVRGPSVRGLTGDSTVYRAAKAVALHVAQERFASTYFQNGASLGGFVKFPASISPEGKQRIADDFRKLYGGHRRAHGWAFLENGMEIQESGGNPDRSQLIPSRTFSVEEIARYFQVPLVRLGVQSAAVGYGTNVQQLNLAFVRDALTPWINRLCEEAEYKLFPQKAPWKSVEIDTGWLTKGDDEQRARANAASIESGVLTVNEARAEEGRNGIGPAGDLHIVKSGMLELSAENLKKPEPPPPPAPMPEKNELDEESEEDDSEDMPARREEMNLARDAVTTMLADAFGRHAKRLSNLKSQTRRDLTDDERAKYRARLVDECASAFALAKRATGRNAGPDLATFMDAIDAGEPTAKAAERLVAATWEHRDHS